MVDTRWWSDRVSRWLVAAGTATMLVTSALPGPALALSPSDGGTVTVDTVVTIDESAGDQFDPHVSGDLAVYTSGANIDFYDFVSGTTGVVTPDVDSSDRLSDVSDGRIVFSREDSHGSTSIHVFDVGSSSTTEIGAPAAFTLHLNAAIGSSTVAYIDQLLASGGELVVADLSAPAATTRITNDTRADGQPQVAPGGDLVVYQSCASGSQASCDVHQADWDGSSWAVTNLTTNDDPDLNPDTDGTIVVYDSIRDGERDVYWQPAGGGSPEEVLSLVGPQRNPSVRAGVIAFESATDAYGAADLFVYEVATNRTFRITSTVADESLNDIDVLPDGTVHLVWTSGVATERDVHGAIFELPRVQPPAYAFGGFLQPIDALPTLNSLKAGAAVPVRFSLGGDHGLDIFAADSPASQVIDCGSAASVDPIEQTVAAGSSSLQYDPLTDTYTYVWKTAKTWAGTCRQLVLGLADGSFQLANFKFK